MDIPFDGVLHLFVKRLEGMSKEVALCGRSIELAFETA